MKNFILSLFYIISYNSFTSGHDLIEGRGVHASVFNFLDPEIINILDNDKLTISASKAHNTWKENLYYKLKDKLMNNLDSVLTLIIHHNTFILAPNNTPYQLFIKSQHTLNEIIYMMKQCFPKREFFG